MGTVHSRVKRDESKTVSMMTIMSCDPVYFGHQSTPSGIYVDASAGAAQEGARPDEDDESEKRPTELIFRGGPERRDKTDEQGRT